MKKTLMFIPLGIGISSAIIYLFNIIQFRIINNSISLFQILSNLKIYLYISIGSFIFYFLLRFLFILSEKNRNYVNSKEEVKEDIIEEKDGNNYTPNYDYVPLYKKETVVKEEHIKTKKCPSCEVILNISDNYCYNCGSLQNENNKTTSILIKNIVNILEIVILILILYFSLVALFDFKANLDPNFKSPFRVSMTK